MPDRDYAAPIPLDRRLSIWQKIRGSRDWDSALPLAAGLRERVSDLLRSQTPTQDPLFSPPIPEDLQEDRSIRVHHRQSHIRNDSTQHDSLAEDPRQDLVATVQGGGSYRRPPQRRPSQSAQLPPIRPHSPIWNADFYDNPRPAPAPGASTAERQKHEHSSTHVVYQRDGQGHLIPPPTSDNGPSRSPTIRRRPVQSSLRSEVLSGGSYRTKTLPIIDNSNAASVGGRVAPAGSQTGGYSHHPGYSLLPSFEPHILPRPHTRAPTTARQAVTNATHNSSQTYPHALRKHQQAKINFAHEVAELQATPFASSTSPTNAIELQGSLAYDPPSPQDISLLPMLWPPRPSLPNNASVATFENPRSNPRPALTRHEAQIEGAKTHVEDVCRGWRARLLKLGRCVQREFKREFGSKIRSTHEGMRKIDRHMDVWMSGSLPDCACDACRKRRTPEEEVARLRRAVLEIDDADAPVLVEEE